MPVQCSDRLYEGCRFKLSSCLHSVVLIVMLPSPLELLKLHHSSNAHEMLHPEVESFPDHTLSLDVLLYERRNTGDF